MNDPTKAATTLQNFSDLAERSLKQNLAARHPELLAVDPETDERNAQAIDKIFLERVNSGDAQFDDANYELAFLVAHTNGLLTLGDPGVVGPEAEGMAYQAGVPMQDVYGRIVYPPATEAEALERMSTPEMAEYLRNKYQQPRPPNLWEQFPTQGERHFAVDNSKLGPVETQELLEKMQKGMQGG
jgi:hypothetical protein